MSTRQGAGVVVVAGDDHHLGAIGGEAQQGVVDEALRTRATARRCRTGRRPRRRDRPRAPRRSRRSRRARRGARRPGCAPRSALPTCQSPVCRRRITTSPSNGSGIEPAVPAIGPCLRRAGGPRREREVDQHRHGEPRLADVHRPRLEDRGPLALRTREPAVLLAPRLGRIEPTDDADGAVGHHPALDLARRLLRTDQDDAEAAAALGDVEQDLLDRAGPLARCVLVQLVEHDELQRLGHARTPPCARTPGAARRRRRSAGPARAARGCRRR